MIPGQQLPQLNPLEFQKQKSVRKTQAPKDNFDSANKSI